MILIVGLGNPGPDYAKTRHNFGFMVVDHLASRYSLSWQLDKKMKAEVAELRGHEKQTKKIVLLKPQTFMNLSGEAVGAMARFYQVELKDIWVVADDLDLPLGMVRVRHEGASGGHHGLESIEKALGSTSFCRVRLGIRGADQRQDHLDNKIETNVFVTGRFESKEELFVTQVVERAATVLEEGIEQGELRAHSYEVTVGE